ncbi:MAG: leucine-rich repeat domain-containing protein [Alphaproteobacteria bacterium]|nr:leucine-rich repeat domain-containing protein [Alphaproteobacteria bacterium]
MKNTIMTLLWMMTIISFNVSATETSGNCGPIQSGDGTSESPYVYGNNCTWNLENGTLTISGTGAMADYYFSGKGTNAITTAPWGTDVQYLVINSGITHLGERAFTGLKDVTTLNIPDTVTSIGWDAFWNMSGVSGDLVVPNSVTSIGDFAFQEMNKVTSLTIGDSVTSIGEYAFDKMTNLTTLIIPDSVTQIGKQAFKDMTSLETLVIGDSVTSIGKSAFIGLSDSAKIYCTPNTDCLTNTQAKTQNIVPYTKDQSGAYALLDEDGNIITDAATGNPIYYLSAGDMTTQANPCTSGYESCATQALNARAQSLADKGKVCNSFENCQALVYADYNGQVLKLNGKDYASLADLLKGQAMAKRIYTVEEAMQAVEATGRDTVNFRIRYK